MTEAEKENIKYRLSDLGVKVGELALKYISDLEKEIAELKKNALVFHDYETEKPQKEGECILIIERELCGKKIQIKCLHYAEETNMGIDFITNHKILKWAELPEIENGS